MSPKLFADSADTGWPTARKCGEAQVKVNALEEARSCNSTLRYARQGQCLWAGVATNVPES